jgi:hypothetical protein
MSLSGDFNAISRLFGDAVEQLGKLVQNEVELAKAELAQKISRAGLGAGYVGAAAILAMPVLFLLLMSLALALVEVGLSPAIAHLAAAGCGAVGCGILAAVGFSYLKPGRLKPKVTMQEVKRDLSMAKELAR